MPLPPGTRRRLPHEFDEPFPVLERYPVGAADVQLAAQVDGQLLGALRLHYGPVLTHDQPVELDEFGVVPGVKIVVAADLREAAGSPGADRAAREEQQVMTVAGKPLIKEHGVRHEQVVALVGQYRARAVGKPSALSAAGDLAVLGHGVRRVAESLPE